MAKDLIRNLIQVNPFDRLSAEEALLHPWIRADEDFFFSPSAKKELDSELKVEDDEPLSGKHYLTS
jgi:serine/threonine protein kinase